MKLMLEDTSNYVYYVTKLSCPISPIITCRPDPIEFIIFMECDLFLMANRAIFFVLLI